MQTHFRMLVTTVLLAAAAAVGAQTVVKGKLVDADNGEPLVGAQVRIVGDKSATVTNAEGEFSLQNPRRHREITVSYLGFKTQNFSVNKSGQMGTLSLSPDEVMLEGVTVSGTMAFDRKTPVALSNVTAEDIEERLGGDSFSVASLKKYRQFYQLYPDLAAPVVGFVADRIGKGCSPIIQLPPPSSPIGESAIIRSTPGPLVEKPGVEPRGEEKAVEHLAGLRLGFLDRLADSDFFVARQKLHLPHLVQIHPDRIFDHLLRALAHVAGLLVLLLDPREYAFVKNISFFFRFLIAVKRAHKQNGSVDLVFDLGCVELFLIK